MSTGKGFLNKLSAGFDSAMNSIGGGQGGGGKISGPGMQGGGAVGGGEGKGARFGGGIGNTPMRGGASGSGYLGAWGEGSLTNLAIALRMVQLVLVFILLIIVIVLASFQSKWIGSLSGLTAFLLIVVLLTFIGILFFLGLSFAPHSLQDTVDRLVRIFEQPRLSLVMNGIGSALWLILAMTQTISAYTSAGCKDPTKDPHADSSKGKKDDFIKELPSFCTTKKAGAIFCWIFWAACVAMLLVFLHSWRLSRKSGPRIPPFVHPADDGAFAPIADDIDGDAGDDMYARDHAGIPISSRYGEGGDGRYGEGQYGGGYDDDLRMAHAYGMQASNGGAPLQYGRADPFADNAAIPRQSYDYGAYGVGGAVPAQDPYAAIQYQLRTERAPQLPPTYPN